MTNERTVISEVLRAKCFSISSEVLQRRGWKYMWHFTENDSCYCGTVHHTAPNLMLHESVHSYCCKDTVAILIRVSSAKHQPHLLRLYTSHCHRASGPMWVPMATFQLTSLVWIGLKAERWSYTAGTYPPVSWETAACLPIWDSTTYEKTCGLYSKCLPRQGSCILCLTMCVSFLGQGWLTHTRRQGPCPAQS